MIDKIRYYLIRNHLVDSNNGINIEYLGEEPTQFSLVKVPVNPILENYVDGSSYRQYEFQLLSRNIYSAELVNNIANSNFYDEFRDKVEELNKQGRLPAIDGIDKIECLDNGGIATTTPNTAQYSILMRITYYKKI